MKTQPNMTTGMSGKLFFGLLVFVLGGLFLVGYILSPSSGPNWYGMALFLGRFTAKWAISEAYGAFFFALFWTQVLDLSLLKIPDHLKEKDNDSYSIVIVTFLIALPAALLLFAGGKTIAQFAGNGLTKGSMGTAIGVLFSVGIAYASKVRSLDDFARWVKETGNNSYVILICGTFLASVAVAVAAA